MGRKDDEPTERINFELTGELARWLGGLKEQGYVTSNPDAVRQALILLRDHLSKLGIKSDQHKKRGED